jgi:hypothetical protein
MRKLLLVANLCLGLVAMVQISAMSAASASQSEPMQSATARRVVTRHHDPGNRGPRIKEAIEIDARGGNLGDGVTFLTQKSPQALDVGNAAGEATANTNNRDRAVAECRAGVAHPKRPWILAASIMGPKLSDIFARKAVRCA